MLYKRNHDMVLLKCMDKREANMLVKEIHEGSFRTYDNWHAMAKKIFRASYYLFHKFQIYVGKMHVPSMLLNVLTSPWPFSMLGIDMIGSIEPKAYNGHLFILVAIDYFTNLIELTSYTNLMRQVVAHILKKEISTAMEFQARPSPIIG